MKEYIITVNGKNYDVMVEERGGGSIVTTATTPQPAAAAPAADASGDAGSIKIEAGAAGKVFRERCSVWRLRSARRSKKDRPLLCLK